MRQSVYILTALFAGIALGVFAGELRSPAHSLGAATVPPSPTLSPSAHGGDEQSSEALVETAASASRATLATLVREMERAEQERQALLDQHRELRSKIERLEARLATAPQLEAEPSSPVAAELGANELPAASSPEPQSGELDALLAAGFDAYQAAEIKQRAGEAEMDRLYLRDRAIREGWFRSERYNEELELLEGPEDYLRARMGDQAFDRYLYASGERNRLRIESVIDASPAAAAGIESGDLIFRYANQRIFSSADLRAAMADGNAGESVAVEVSRDGSRRSFYVSRGPLGVRLAPARVEP